MKLFSFLETFLSLVFLFGIGYEFALKKTEFFIDENFVQENFVGKKQSSENFKNLSLLNGTGLDESRTALFAQRRIELLKKFEEEKKKNSEFLSEKKIEEFFLKFDFVKSVQFERNLFKNTKIQIVQRVPVFRISQTEVIDENSIRMKDHLSDLPIFYQKKPMPKEIMSFAKKFSELNLSSVFFKDRWIAQFQAGGILEIQIEQFDESQILKTLNWAETQPRSRRLVQFIDTKKGVVKTLGAI